MTEWITKKKETKWITKKEKPTQWITKKKEAYSRRFILWRQSYE